MFCSLFELIACGCAYLSCGGCLPEIGFISWNASRGGNGQGTDQGDTYLHSCAIMVVCCVAHCMSDRRVRDSVQIRAIHIYTAVQLWWCAVLHTVWVTGEWGTVYRSGRSISSQLCSHAVVLCCTLYEWQESEGQCTDQGDTYVHSCAVMLLCCVAHCMSDRRVRDSVQIRAIHMYTAVQSCCCAVLHVVWVAEDELPVGWTSGAHIVIKQILDHFSS